MHTQGLFSYQYLKFAYSGAILTVWLGPFIYKNYTFAYSGAILTHPCHYLQPSKLSLIYNNLTFSHTGPIFGFFCYHFHTHRYYFDTSLSLSPIIKSLFLIYNNCRLVFICQSTRDALFYILKSNICTLRAYFHTNISNLHTQGLF